MNNGIKLNELQNHFREKWSCSNAIISNLLKKLGKDRIIKVENFRIYITDEWLKKQKKLR